MEIDRYIQGVSQQCPNWLKDELEVISIRHIDFSGIENAGSIVVHKSIAKDVLAIFKDLFELKFPINSVKPLCEQIFWDDNGWSDEISMRLNNTSAFNYRTINGRSKLSTHALGMAIDINPIQNPFVSNGIILPKLANYDINSNGTFVEGSIANSIFHDRGFFWGGNFNDIKDYHHFERKTKGYEKYFVD